MLIFFRCNVDRIIKAHSDAKCALKDRQITPYAASNPRKEKLSKKKLKQQTAFGINAWCTFGKTLLPRLANVLTIQTAVCLIKISAPFCTVLCVCNVLMTRFVRMTLGNERVHLS